MPDDSPVRRAAAMDDVDLVTYADRWPVSGTRAERRARRGVLTWFALAVLLGVAFIVVFLVWPWQYQQSSEQYEFYTPLLGLTFGGALLCLSFGLVTYAKRFLPREVAVQQRHDGPPAADDQTASAAIVSDSAVQAGMSRRSWMGRAVGAGLGVAGLGSGVLVAGGFVKDPWDTPARSESLWHTLWAPEDGETVYLRRDVGDPHGVTLVRPGDIAPGGFVTVVPFRESERGDRERLLEVAHSADSAAQLFHLRPDAAGTGYGGRDGFNYRNFCAFSKICTHLGCPVSLYEASTQRLLCPCHQSQFDVTDSARPVFGPAVRALPQLPIALSSDGYFVATGDFSAAVGPAFWELG